MNDREQRPRAAEDEAAGLYALEEALDGELSPELAERLQRHLETCPECAEEVERVRRMKALVRRCCAADAAPPALRERIAIEYRRVTVTTYRTRTREGGAPAS